jgi:protein-L-isoaspartate O-methyltransferase
VTSAAELNSRLVRALEATGHLSSAWRDAFITVERHRFISDRVWTDTSKPALQRGDDPQGWLQACYADQPLTTQIDDGDDTGRGYSSSSASMPTTVAMMLHALDVEPGMRVLEIGTGVRHEVAQCK